VLDNGMDLEVDEGSCTGGNGAYERPVCGVDKAVITEVSAALHAMYIRRREEVKRADAERPVNLRKKNGIMEQNPASVAARGVSVLARLAEGVKADAASQRVRLARLGSLSAADHASTPASQHPVPPALGSTSPALTNAASGMASNSAGACPGSSFLASVPAVAAAPQDPPRTPGCAPAPVPPPNAINAGTLPAALPPHQAPTGGTNHSLDAAVAVSAALPGSGFHGGAEWSTVPIPRIKSCRDLAALWQDGTLADGRVLLSHSLEVLCDKDARQRLYPGRLLRAVATRRTRYIRVCAEIKKEGGINEFEAKWGSDVIISKVYHTLTAGQSKGKKRKE